MIKQMERNVGNWWIWVKGVDGGSLYHSSGFSSCWKTHKNKTSHSKRPDLNSNVSADPGL